MSIASGRFSASLSNMALNSAVAGDVQHLKFEAERARRLLHVLRDNGRIEAAWG